jgi:alanine dehydrogenase
MARILVVRNDEIDQHISPADCVPLVEQAFRALTAGQAELPAKYHDRGDWGLWFFMGGNVFPQQATAVKLGFAAQGRLTCQVIYYDHETCEPKGLFEGLKVTNLRTGAAAAIGAKYLARPESRVAAFIGAGQVCRHSLAALVACFALERVLVYDLSAVAASDFAVWAQARYGLPVSAVSDPRQAVCEADIVVSATPSRQPIVLADWVKPGTHFSAMGADGKGKQELDGAIHRRARIVCDRTEQCLKWGDINNSVSAGLIGPGDLAGEIGQVISGQVAGRTDPEQITLFDATGMGIQDAVVAKVIYDIATQKGLGTAVEL